MRTMATLGVAVLTTWVSSLMAADRSAELERVVASERAFAARAQQVNPRQAFAEFFAPEALLYTPYPVPAFPRLREAPDWGVNIQWRPVAAAISGAGDMGYTTGPSEYRRTSAEPPVGFGHYTSVWQRQPDGRYLVRIDIGIEHPAPPTTIEDRTAQARAPMAAPVLDRATLSATLAGLREVDARIGAQDPVNATVSLAAVLADDVRLHRGGRLPVTDRAQVLADLNAHQESLAWTPEGAVVAESGDFGFVYGRGQWKRLQPEETGELAYLNIWQRRSGDWRLIVHVSNPVPVAAPTSAR